jgi:hypothetical protein
MAAGFANRHICNLPYLQYIEVVCNGENYRVLIIDDVAQSQRKNTVDGNDGSFIIESKYFLSDLRKNTPGDAHF